MKHLLLVLLLFSLSGCMPDKESPAYSSALQQVKDMIDKGVFKSKYIILYEMASGKFGSIYRIDPFTSFYAQPSMERPEKVIEHKGKFICFISPMAQSDISYKDLLAMTDFENDTDSTIYDMHRDSWFLGVSKDGKRHSLTNYLDADRRTYYLVPYTLSKLWEYMSKDYNEANPPRFILGTYKIIVDDTDKSKDSLKKHLEAIKVGMYYYYSDDRCFTEAQRKENPPFFAVLNGNDTLRFNIDESPIYQHMNLESTPNPSFFKALPTDNTLNSLHNLMRDSTFYFQFEEGRYMKHPILFSYIQWTILVDDTKDGRGYSLFKEGVNPVLKEDGSYFKWLDSE